jgi:cytidylate kinase
MAVITISQGSYSGSRMLAETVADRMGYRCVHREEVLQKATLWGVSEEDLRTALERAPSFFGQSQHTKYRYLSFIQAALSDLVHHGKAVYSGLAGHLLLGKGPHVLRTRLVAPMEFRVAMVEEKRQLSRKDAIDYIERMDEERSKWTSFLYGVDWTDASLYDLVINLEQMTLVEASDVVCSLAATNCFKTTSEILAHLDNLALASCAKAHLAMHDDTMNLEFEITAQSGKVTLKGAIEGPVQAKKIRGVLERIPGVREVSLKELELVSMM